MVKLQNHEQVVNRFEILLIISRRRTFCILLIYHIFCGRACDIFVMNRKMEKLKIPLCLFHWIKYIWGWKYHNSNAAHFCISDWMRRWIHVTVLRPMNGKSEAGLREKSQRFSLVVQLLLGCCWEKLFAQFLYKNIHLSCACVLFINSIISRTTENLFLEKILSFESNGKCRM